MAETVLVTGGTGFIAGWCIAGLLERGYSVRATLRDRSKEERVRSALSRINPQLPVERLAFCIADLTRDEGWDDAVAGCDYVLHVASPLGGGASGDRESYIAPARDGTLRVLRAVARARVRRVVMTSAAAAARGPLSSSITNDETVWADPADPQFDAYRVSKILAERAAWDFMRDIASTQFTTILPGAVFGPLLMEENRGSVQIIQGLLEGRPPAMPRLGFWIVDVRDLAEMHIRAMIAPEAAGQRFIVAGDFLWMEEIAQKLRDELGAAGARVPTRRLPSFVVRLLLPFMPTLRTLAPLIGRRFSLTSEKARRVLGFAPRPVATTLADCARGLLASSAVKRAGRA